MHPMEGQAAVLLAILSTALCLSSPRVCQTPECLALSAHITSNMNLTADPCEDFNEFACGNYAANTPYDPNTMSWSRDGESMPLQYGLDAVKNKLKNRMFEMLHFQRGVIGEDADVNVMNRLASDLFRSCVSWYTYRSIQSRSVGENFFRSEWFFDDLLEHLIQSFPPVTQKDWFERALAKMVRFGTWNMIAINPTSQLMATWRKSMSVDNITRVSLEYKNWKSNHYNYTDYLNYFIRLSWSYKLLLDNASEFASIALEIKSAAASNGTDGKSTSSSRVSSGGKTALTIRELDGVSARIDSKDPFSWSAFLDGVLDGEVSQNTTIEISGSTDGIAAAKFLSFLKKRSLASSSESKFTSHFSFLVFDWLLSFAQFFPADLARQWRRNPIKYQRGLPFGDGDPVTDCLQGTNILLGPVVERMFQKQYHDDTFDHVRAMADLIQNATIANVRGEKWITESSKPAIIDKIVQLERVIGFNVMPLATLKKMYNSTIQSYKKLGNYTFSPQMFRDFGTAVSFAMCAYAGRKNNLLSTDTVINFFTFSDSLTVNAFNTMAGNQIVFPMGILSPFLYHRSYPDYMNLGGIGVVIGHEIGHGFDNTGHELRTNGVRGHFWDNATEDGFLRHMRCVTNRFGSYQLVPGMSHYSNSTVGNDISDIMGIRSAFKALQLLGERGRNLRLPNLPDSLTPEKLFFVQAAQPWCSKSEPSALATVFKYGRHSPPHIRIRGMMENSQEFAEVFKCKRGQAMNPKEKCQFW